MISLNELQFGYPKSDKPLFNQLNLELASGTICGMLGPNGAGKSTLLKILAGLMIPQSGSCEVFGYTPSQRLPSFLADVFLLPEEIFVPALSANEYENRFASFYPKFDHGVFAELLAEFELPRDKVLTKLSLGQKKKFILSFGIASNTRLLIMDEPTNGLDIPSKSQFRKILVNHYAENRSFIISTHQVGDLEGLIDSLIIVAKGKILLKEELDFVASRICISKESQAPNDALYFEQTLEGYSVLRENHDGIEAHVDLGILFGFVTVEEEKTRSLFSGAL